MFIGYHTVAGAGIMLMLQLQPQQCIIAVCILSLTISVLLLIFQMFYKAIMGCEIKLKANVALLDCYKQKM